MAWIRTIEWEEAEGKLRELYEELAQKRGKLSNIMAVQSLNPEAMRAHLDLYLCIMFQRCGLSRPEREMLAVVVSAANRCDYCIAHHSAALLHYWKDPRRVSQLARDFRQLDLSPRELAMCQYAWQLTREPENIREDSIQAMRQAGLDDEQILATNLVVAYFNFVNRIALGLGVTFDPEEVAGYKY